MDEVRKEMDRIRRWRRWVTRWIVIFSILVIVGQWQNQQDSQHNKERIADIQHSRVLGCQATYNSIREVFKPFFPPPGHRTAKQKHDLAKFNAIIKRHKVHCRRQVAAS